MRISTSRTAASRNTGSKQQATPASPGLALRQARQQATPAPDYFTPATTPIMVLVVLTAAATQPGPQAHARFRSRTATPDIWPARKTDPQPLRLHFRPSSALQNQSGPRCRHEHASLSAACAGRDSFRQSQIVSDREKAEPDCPALQIFFYTVRPKGISERPAYLSPRPVRAFWFAAFQRPGLQSAEFAHG
jgi:hypothetical protein